MVNAIEPFRGHLMEPDFGHPNGATDLEVFIVKAKKYLGPY